MVARVSCPVWLHCGDVVGSLFLVYPFFSPKGTVWPTFIMPSRTKLQMASLITTSTLKSITKEKLQECELTTTLVLSLLSDPARPSFTNTPSDTLARGVERAHTAVCAWMWVCMLSPSAVKRGQTSLTGWKRRDVRQKERERQRQRERQRERKGQNKCYRDLHSTSLQVRGVCMCVCGKWVLGVVVSLR